MQRELTEREKWLIERIGKRIYRPDTGCQCEPCQFIYNNGLVIRDRQQALYLSEMEIEYTLDGTPIKYFDTRQEALDFENENNKP